MQDSAAAEILGFLEEVERHGRAREAAREHPVSHGGRALGPAIVEESRALRCMLRGMFGALS